MKLSRKEFIKKTGFALSLLCLPGFKTVGFKKGSILNKKMDLTPQPWQDGTWSLEIPGTPSGGDILFLNQTAIDIWNLIDGRGNEADISSALSERYDAPLSETTPAVMEFISSLRTMALV